MGGLFFGVSVTYSMTSGDSEFLSGDIYKEEIFYVLSCLFLSFTDQ